MAQPTASGCKRGRGKQVNRNTYKQSVTDTTREGQKSRERDRQTDRQTDRKKERK